MKVNKFLTHGASITAGTLGGLLATKLAQHEELIEPATNVLFSSNEALGVGLIGSVLAVAITRLSIDIYNSKQKQNDDSQFEPKKPKMR
jgi:dihydrodipicolinate reductase